MRIKKTEAWALAVAGLAAAALLLVFSQCSPLYPTNILGEAHAFFTMGRGMLAGRIPYRDLVLGAGPVVYALHALAALISPNGFFGVWLLEIVALTALIYISWKAALRISGIGILSMLVSVMMALLLVSSRAFVTGDTVEEFALPLQMFALFDLLVYLQDPERKMSSYRMALHGFLAGCVFWMKYTLVGVHLAFIVVIAIDDMVHQWEMKGAICMCLEFAAGAVIATLPWIAYFGVNDALGTFLRAYLGGDWKYIIESFDPLRRAFAGLVSGAIHNPVAALALLCGAGFLLHRLVQRRWNAACSAVVAAFVCAVLMMYFKDDRYRFSPMCAGAFLMLCAGPLALLAKYAWKQRRIYGVLLGCALVACAGYSCLVNDGLKYIGYPKEQLPQQVFAEYIEENGGGTVFTYNIADCGFYLALDQMPQFRIFADSKAYYNSAMDRDWDIAENAEAEWIISRSSRAPGGMYTQVKWAGDMTYNYYLWRRIEK